MQLDCITVFFPCLFSPLLLSTTSPPPLHPVKFQFTFLVLEWSAALVLSQFDACLTFLREYFFFIFSCHCTQSPGMWPSDSVLPWRKLSLIVLEEKSLLRKWKREKAWKWKKKYFVFGCYLMTNLIHPGGKQHSCIFVVLKASKSSLHSPTGFSYWLIDYKFRSKNRGHVHSSALFISSFPWSVVMTPTLLWQRSS